MCKLAGIQGFKTDHSLLVWHRWTTYHGTHRSSQYRRNQVIQEIVHRVMGSCIWYLNNASKKPCTTSTDIALTKPPPHPLQQRVLPMAASIFLPSYRLQTLIMLVHFRPYQIDYMFHGEADYKCWPGWQGKKIKIKRWISLKTSWISLKRNHKLPKVSLPWAYHHSSRFDDILTTFDQDALLNHTAMMQMAIDNKVSHFNCTVLVAACTD